MRKISYSVAMSLDGYIAGPNGEDDWIVLDPEIDFDALLKRFDTVLVGARTYDAMVRRGSAAIPGIKTFVFSRTLEQKDHPGVTIVSTGHEELLKSLRTAPGKDILLMGGGALFRSLLEKNLIDTVEASVIPVLLGGGIPLLPATAARTKLSLSGHRIYKSGIVGLEYIIASSAR